MSVTNESLGARLLSIREAAELLGVSVPVLYRWAAERRIPHARIGRLLKFEGGELAKWVARNRVAVEDR